MAWGRKKERTQGAAIRARRSTRRSAPRSQGPHSRRPNKSRRNLPNAGSTMMTTIPPPPERKARASKSGSKRRSKSAGRSRIGRLFYWSAVLGLWAAIAIVGVVIWVGAHLPAIQSLEIPKRPPTIQIVGLDGSVLATPRRNGRQQCRAEGFAALSAEGLHRHRGPPLLFALRRRSRRHRARRGGQRACTAACRRAARR